MPPAAPGLTQAIISSALIVLALAAFLLRFASMRRWMAVALGACLLDQVTKALVLRYLFYSDDPFRRILLLDGQVEILYQRNDGLGFGGSPGYLLAASLGLVGLLLVVYQQLSQRRYRMPVLTELGTALVVGGLLGILLDRLRLGGVVDFLSLGQQGDYTYNLADLSAFAAALLFGARGVQLLVRRGAAPTRSAPKVRWRWAAGMAAVSVLSLGVIWHVSADPGSSRPALHRAAERGDLAQVERLLAKGADADQRDRHGLTALHCAAWAGQAVAARALLAHGASATAPVREGGLGPLDYAVGCHDRQAAVKTARVLLEHGAKPSPGALREAAMRRNPELAKLLLSRGGTADSVRGTTISLIGAAVVPDNAAAVRALLAAGAEVNGRQESDGQTALHKAAGHDDAEVAGLLLDAGAEANARDNEGATALYAARGESPTSGRATAKHVVAVLLAHGADPNLATRDGRTPLMRAAVRGDLETAKLLLRAGARVDAKGPEGWSALHYAAAKGRADVVKELLRAGADPEARTEAGKTPADMVKDADVRALFASAAGR